MIPASHPLLYSFKRVLLQSPRCVFRCLTKVLKITFSVMNHCESQIINRVCLMKFLLRRLFFQCNLQVINNSKREALPASPASMHFCQVNQISIFCSGAVWSGVYVWIWTDPSDSSILLLLLLVKNSTGLLSSAAEAGTMVTESRSRDREHASLSAIVCCSLFIYIYIFKKITTE